MRSLNLSTIEYDSTRGHHLNYSSKKSGTASENADSYTPFERYSLAEGNVLLPCL
jgi:hypothetical protein